MQLKGGLTAINTKLGWTFCGRYEEPFEQSDKKESTFFTNLAIQELNVADLWNLEIIGISDTRGNLSKDEENEVARKHFLSSVCKTQDGRYSVGLPWIQHDLVLPSNRNIAEKRLFSTTRKLKSLNKFEEYNEIFRDWLEEGGNREDTRRSVGNSRA